MSRPGDFVQRCVDCDATGSGYVRDAYLLDDDCFFCGGILEGFLIIEPVDNSLSQFTEIGLKRPRPTSPHLAPGEVAKATLTSPHFLPPIGEKWEVKDGGPK